MKKYVPLVLISLFLLTLGCAQEQQTPLQDDSGTSAQASPTAAADSIDSLLAEMVDKLLQEAAEADATLQEEESDDALLGDDSATLLDVGASATLDEESGSDSNDSVAALVDSYADTLLNDATTEQTELDAEQTDGDLLEDDSQAILDVGDSYDATTIE